jgi:HAD superfamily hydrolase (TIGR01549 family)
MSLNSSTQERRKPKQNRADEPQPKYYLLFDAGGTLVFPDQSFLIQQAWAHGVELTHEQLFSGYYRLIHRLDCEARNGGGFPNHSWPERYAYALFETLRIDTSVTHAVAQAFEARHRSRNLWAFTFDWVRKTLSFLDAQGYRMSVISNSDGRTAEVFQDLGLDHYFECIFDSALLGKEKPDPAVCELALRELNLQPADALYIGDFYEADVRGANRAGLGALHLDPLGLYADWPGVHLPDVRHLPDWLTQYAVTPWAFDLFPTRRALNNI